MRNRTPFTLIVLLFLLLSDGVLGQDCETVNLVTAKDSPFNKIPVLNQGSVNICYAYTASQMADYYLIKKGSTQRNIHAGWVALNYALSKGKNGLEIGHTKEALESLQEAGVCDFETFARHWKEFTPVALKKATLKSLAEVFKTICPPVTRKRISLPPTRMYNFRYLTDDDSYNVFVKKRLDESEWPLSISYCSNVWHDQDYDGIDLNSANIRDHVKKGCNYHESLIVGKKLIGGNCHFLVRNTWGEKWTKDNNKLKCLCRSKSTGEISDECDATRNASDEFSVEACWIPSASLSRNIGQITFFE